MVELDENNKLNSCLGVLLKAPSKQVVQRIVMRVFVHRNDVNRSEGVQKMIRDSMDVTDVEAEQLRVGLVNAIKRVMYKNDVAALDDVFKLMDTRLADLVRQIFETNLPHWRVAAINQRVSLPKLVNVDWRVDIQTASEHIDQMVVPSVLVGLQIQDQPTHRDIVPDVKDVAIEMNKETLQTVLDGLNQIREQLASIHSE